MLKKKGAEQCRFERRYSPFSFPWTCSRGRQFFLLSSMNPTRHIPAKKRPLMHSHDEKKQGSRALPAPPIGQPTRRYGRAAKPCSPGVAIGRQ